MPTDADYCQLSEKIKEVLDSKLSHNLLYSKCSVVVNESIIVIKTCLNLEGDFGFDHYEEICDALTEVPCQLTNNAYELYDILDPLDNFMTYLYMNRKYLNY